MIFGHFIDFGHFPIEIPIEAKKKGRKGCRAKTKTVLKSVSKWAKFGSMQNLKFQSFLNKNPPNGISVQCDIYIDYRRYIDISIFRFEISKKVKK